MQLALGATRAEGSFRQAAEAALAGLRRHATPLAALLEAVLCDPLVDWSAERELQSAKKDLDVAGASLSFTGMPSAATVLCVGLLSPWSCSLPMQCTVPSLS